MITPEFLAARSVMLDNLAEIALRLLAKASAEEPIPRLGLFCTLIGADYHDGYSALVRLQKQGKLKVAFHGIRAGRGHIAITMADGKVLRTLDCPIPAP